MKGLKKMAAALGIAVTGLSGAPQAQPLAQAHVPSGVSPTGTEEKGIPVAPQQQTQVTMAVRGKDRTRLDYAGLFSPGFGAPPIAYRMAARSGWGTHAKARKVRTHKERRC